MTESEKHIILGYLLNLLKCAGGRAGVVEDICGFLGSDEALLENENDDISVLLESSLKEEGKPRSLVEMSARELKRFLSQLQGIISKRHHSLMKQESSILEKNLQLLAAHLGLDSVDVEFIGLVIRHNNHSQFAKLLNIFCREQLDTMEACAICIGVSAETLIERLQPNCKLLSSGLLSPAKRTGSDLDDYYNVLDSVHNALTRNQGGPENLLAAMLGEPCQASLDWDDFDHLGATRDRVAGFLRQVVKDRIMGINILLWGAPGTGKTEFCKSLADHLGMKLYAVKEKDEDGGEPNRTDRLNFYKLSQNLLRNRSDSLQMFDEMDDLLGDRSLAKFFGAKPTFGSKVFMNRAVENNPVPTFWLINDVSSLDEAFIRRMSLALEMKSPPSGVCERVWKRVLQRNRLELSDADLKELTELNIPPAVVDSAARFTASIGGTAEDFRFAAQGIVHAMRGGRPQVKEESGKHFHPELTKADLDLAMLTERLCQSPSRTFSLCLYGPAGTGKSAYLRYLADKMRMPVLIKRASDLLNKYVGESEKGIATAFQEAIDCDAFLIFDEADSLLGDRRHAERSWEVSQVNEMLTWMERHPLPFACTTNLRERLDPASLRRFTFKCRFDYLESRQIAQAFTHFFGHEMPAADQQQLAALTPGDFAVVRRKAEVLGLLGGPRTLMELLREEAWKKGEGMSRRVGFS
jgi:SpoVK/Ycf46/Vps4 family AAA+-type ATPase